MVASGRWRRIAARWRSDRVLREHYTTTVGKRRDRVVRMTESRFGFTGAGGARLTLVVRAAADGVAYRYELAENYGPVLGEASAFTVPWTVGTPAPD